MKKIYYVERRKSYYFPNGDNFDIPVKHCGFFNERKEAWNQLKQEFQINSDEELDELGYDGTSIVIGNGKELILGNEVEVVDLVAVREVEAC